MRLISPLLAASVFLFFGCAGAGKQMRTNAPKEGSVISDSRDSERVASDPGNLDVIDPVAPATKDNFPSAALPAEKAGAVIQPAEKPNALAPGFLIRLGHQEDRDLNGSFRIEFDGRISLPYNIVIKAEGLTMEEFRQKVIESYKPYFKSGVRLTVELVEKAYFVELRGLIAKPGKYKVRGDTSLDEVIAMAGGFPVAADSQPRFLKISRAGQMKMVNMEEYYKSGSLRTSNVWRGGEVLFFQKESSYADLSTMDTGTQIQVLGELKRPGEFAHRPGADVYFYMSEAGGPTRDTDFHMVQVYRGPPGKREMKEFALDEPDSVPPVQPGDILVFQADKPTRFQKNVGTAANIASILTAIALLIIAL